MENEKPKTTSIGRLTVDVDMSQIDEAIERAKLLNALMDEAEAKAARLAGKD